MKGKQNKHDYLKKRESNTQNMIIKKPQHKNDCKNRVRTYRLR
jgi:hypothetical protein